MDGQPWSSETAAQRLANGNEPRFDIDKAIGRKGELWMVDVIDGFQNGATEVKYDLRASDTGSVYVEFECYRRGHASEPGPGKKAWRPSGITTTEADVWAFRTGDDRGLIIPVPQLLELIIWCKRRGRVAACHEGSHPTRGALVPLVMLGDRRAIARWGRAGIEVVFRDPAA